MNYLVDFATKNEKEFNKVEEVSESERAKTVDEIRKIIEKKFYE